ncbi:diacylglycerol kinase [Flavobacterium magnum]|uniref:Dihydrofolate reductase n=1 Tax=Flavobacterium magnum TaxID=2162713 RepID=A0A2S0RFY1_9FLAO|nr:dihydrofolate reductase [Flavobacterium magnum]AWA29622.1 diacylglycerol kinase [Flavobacterium magnum]
MVIMIAAAAENDALGKDNDLLWHLPDDFKRFKQHTSGHHIIMGRKTFESFPKPLPDRVHIVITKQKEYRPEGCIVVGSMEEALSRVPANEDAYIIGGGQIYELGMAFADKLDITRVHARFEADAFFPQINPHLWKMTANEFHPKDDRHSYDFSFQAFVRK